MCVYLFDVKLTEDDLKKFETCWSLGDWYVKMYLIPMYLFVVTINSLMHGNYY